LSIEILKSLVEKFKTNGKVKDVKLAFFHDFNSKLRFCSFKPAENQEYMDLEYPLAIWLSFGGMPICDIAIDLKDLELRDTLVAINKIEANRDDIVPILWECLSGCILFAIKNTKEDIKLPKYDKGSWKFDDLIIRNPFKNNDLVEIMYGRH